MVLIPVTKPIILILLKKMKFKKSDLKISFILGCFLLLLGGAGILLGSKDSISCTPINVFLSKDGDNVVKVSWETEDACLGYVLYGDSSYEIERVAINPENLEKSREHEVTITNLLSTNAYYFIVVSNEQPYGNSGKPIAFYLDNIE